VEGTPNVKTKHRRKPKTNENT